VTRALLVLLLAAPASAWELGNGAGVAARGAELVKRWRPYSKTMVDLDIVKKSLQDEEPDWVTRDKEKITPPERPFGRIHGFTMRERDVRYLIVARHSPFEKDDKNRRGPLMALKNAELAATAALFEAVTDGPDAARGWVLSSSAAGRDRRVHEGEDGQPPLQVTWHYLDSYRETGKGGEFYVLLYADKPRAGVPAAPEEGAAGKEPPMRFFKDQR
jgi:hypothetical protein